MKKHDIGLIGLAVMGSNLALNMADNDFSVAIYNRTYSVGDSFIKENPHRNLTLYKELKDFVSSIEKPRKIILMVKAGSAVDYVIKDLLQFLDKDDIVIDGGNSNFKDSIRRTNELKELGVRFMGVGISGGEEGARFGPAIMPGGDLTSYNEISNIFNAISAKVNNEPCSTYIGTDGAGHYVKMVHNGIEYADMQLIAEAYSLLKKVGKLTNKELAETFENWNKGELDSYLIEITANIFTVKDDLTNNDLIDMIKDSAMQKGTGKWTTEEALSTNTDASLLTSAVYARIISSKKEERENASKEFSLDLEKVDKINKPEFIEIVRKALYASKIIAYAQGFDLLKNASKAYNWNLDFASIAKIFRGGCIIRAKFLNLISDAYNKNKDLENLMLDKNFKEILINYQSSLRKTIIKALEVGISVPAFSAAISYFDAYRANNSSANLIQAQRDLFGAHTYERTDREGIFHFKW